MIVVYTKDNHTVLGWSRRTANLVIDENGIRSEDLVMRGVNWNKVEYADYADQEIGTKYDDEGDDIPWILEELNLRDLTGKELKDNQNKSRDLWAEIDELKAKVVTLEKVKKL